MKKILLCLSLLVSLLASSASAERIVFKDPHFDSFGDYKMMQLTNISILNVDSTGFIVDKTADSKILIALRGAMAKKDVTVRLPEQIPASTPGLRSLRTIPEVSIKVYCMGYDRIYHDAWTENRTVMDEYRGSIGYSVSRSVQVTVPRTEKIEHPAGYYNNAEVDIEINVINPLTKDIVYTVRDSRGEGDTSDTTELLKNIFKDFSKDVK